MWDPILDLVLGGLLLAGIFVPLERSHRAREHGHLRPELGLDLAFFGLQSLVVSGALARVNVWLQDTVGAIGPAVLVHAADRWPPWLQVLVAVVLGDLGLYWGHRLSHAVPILWRFHGVHHTARRLDWVAAHREHPLDGLYSQVWFNVPAFVLGLDLTRVMPVLVLRSLWAVFIHSNVRLPLGPLGWLLGDPVLHRWHHAREAAVTSNYANLAPYLDRIFGTHHRPTDEHYALGLVDDRPRGFVAHLVAPFLPRGSRT